MKLKAYAELKEKVERLQSDADQALGAYNQLMRRLLDEMECLTVKQAQAKLKQLERNYREAEKRFKAAVSDFEHTYSDRL